MDDHADIHAHDHAYIHADTGQLFRLNTRQKNLALINEMNEKQLEQKSVQAGPLGWWDTCVKRKSPSCARRILRHVNQQVSTLRVREKKGKYVSFTVAVLLTPAGRE